jgi:hypothetical protein
MTEERDRFREAVERKGADAERRSESTEEQPERLDPSRPPDAASPRQKSSGKGQKTADKWNQ